jgi:uncharacterized membrane protein
MNRRDFEKMHSDSANWHFVCFYFCRLDPRLVVKKRSGAGWTPNFAQPLAGLLLIGLLLGIAIGCEVINILDFPPQWENALVVIGVLMLCLLCSWLARSDR